MGIGPGIQLITDNLIDQVRKKAIGSPRLRQNYNFHESAEENPHRFLNVLIAGTYVTPHRHLEPPKSEGFLVLEGCAAAFLFDDAGRVTDVFLLSGDGTVPELPEAFRGHKVARGIDLAPGIWHTIVALTPSVVCYEVKPGPWVPSTDKEFAAWAPAEGAAGAPAYLESLLDGSRMTAEDSEQQLAAEPDHPSAAIHDVRV